MHRVESVVLFLTELPVDFATLNIMLKNNKYTKNELTKILCEYVEMCYTESVYFRDQYGREARDNEMYDTYLYGICELFLKHGLDVTCIVPGYLCNVILHITEWLAKSDVTVNVIDLLLKKSKESLNTNRDGMIQVFVSLDRIFFDTLIAKGYCKITDTVFKVWLMMIGYGAKLKNNLSPLEMLDGFDITEFKNCDNFEYKVEVIGRKEFALHIKMRESGKVVATVIPEMRRLDSMTFKFQLDPLGNFK